MVGFGPPERLTPSPYTGEALAEWTSKLGAGVEVNLNGGQAIPHADVTNVSWSEATLDTHGFWTSTAPTVLTVPKGLDGVYLAAGTLRWAAHATGYRQQAIGVTSTSGVMSSTTRATLFNADSAVIRAYPMPTRRLYLKAGDQVYASAYQSSTASLNLEASASSNLQLTRIGDLPRAESP